jgi:hypothetical protein
MSTSTDTQQPILAWLGRIGAAGADEVAGHLGISPAAARARLAAGQRRGLVEPVRLLHRQPALYVATRDGLRLAGLAELKPCRVSPAGFAHLREVARVAVAFERRLPGLEVVGERELRVWERDARRPLASAELGLALDGGYARHRPDLVLWPAGRAGEEDAPAVAVEVELTVKAAHRLREIVRGWARSRLVGAVVYYASPEAARAVRRAAVDEQAEAMVHVRALEEAGALPAGIGWPVGSTSPVPSAA